MREQSACEVAERSGNTLGLTYSQQKPRLTPAKCQGMVPVPIPQALPAGGRMAGGDVLHKALLHAWDPGRAVGMVGCQDHAARVLHLHGHRHMSALLPVTKATGGSRQAPTGGRAVLSRAGVHGLAP